MVCRYASLPVVLALAAGCGEPADALEQRDGVAIGSVRAALDACGESVPADRNVDGVPAYKQCSTIEAGAIYSNNGIDTSATKLGADWVRTQFAGGYQCTELAHRYLNFKWKVSWIPNGNAGEWCNTQPPSSSGVVQASAPVHGDLIVFAPSSCGADGTYGHVAVVDVVDVAKGKVTVVEQNQARRGSYDTSCAKCFLHVVANDGTNPGQTIGSGAPVAGDAGAKPAAPADAAAATGKPRPERDAAVDSGARPPPQQDDEDDTAEAPIETGKKADAGTKKDAGSKADEDEDEPSDEAAEDEAQADEEPTGAAAQGCSVEPGAEGNGALLAWLVAVAMMIARRPPTLFARSQKQRALDV